jgi:hypothetical protein
MKTHEKLFKLDKEYYEARQAIILGKDTHVVKLSGQVTDVPPKELKNTTKELSAAEANEIISKSKK